MRYEQITKGMLIFNYATGNAIHGVVVSINAKEMIVYWSKTFLLANTTCVYRKNTIKLYIEHDIFQFC